jgi:hypothetical protein
MPFTRASCMIEVRQTALMILGMTVGSFSYSDNQIEIILDNTKILSKSIIMQSCDHAIAVDW